MSAPNSKRNDTVDTGFQFTQENLKKATDYIAKYPPGRQASAVLPLLDLVQRQCGGWVPQAGIEEVARLLNMPVIRVHEVASFYTMFNLKPVGKYHLQLCGTTPCWLKGAAELKHHCQQKWGIHEGVTTPDGKFSLIEVECLGACVNAPVIQINDDYYEDLTPDLLDILLEKLKNNEFCAPGSQIGRQASAPEGYSDVELVGQQMKPQRTRKARKKGEDVSAER
jgi:NADH-quinone oxidoreductase subunit E